MYVELPEAGSEVEKGNNFGVVESVKVLISTYVPGLTVPSSLLDFCVLPTLESHILAMHAPRGQASPHRAESVSQCSITCMPGPAIKGRGQGAVPCCRQHLMYTRQSVERCWKATKHWRMSLAR